MGRPTRTRRRGLTARAIYRLASAITIASLLLGPLGGCYPLRQHTPHLFFRRLPLPRRLSPPRPRPGPP